MACIGQNGQRGQFWLSHTAPLPHGSDNSNAQCANTDVLAGNQVAIVATARNDIRREHVSVRRGPDQNGEPSLYGDGKFARQ